MSNKWTAQCLQKSQKNSKNSISKFLPLSWRNFMSSSDLKTHSRKHKPFSSLFLPMKNTTLSIKYNQIQAPPSVSKFLLRKRET
uniref:Predicted protein n=1 Tax=Hordeum vulgare subsp. vulgare TaxID=112509 RepID=F2DJC9_HORVV|nr:predicted protein [Hordeum vulgare subsp. vulgare]